MNQTKSTGGQHLASLIAGLALVGVNGLFMALLGGWLTYSGALCGVVYIGFVIATLAGRARSSTLLFNLLLALTLMNFNGWAFSHLGNLLFYLGLYFFPLFGLIMGAAVFRFLSPFRPLSKVALSGIGMLFVLVPWCGGLVLEASYFPQDCYKYYVRKHKRLPDGVTPDQINSDIRQHAKDFLAKNYHSVGVYGYLTWALTSGQVDIPLAGQDKPLTYHRTQRKLGLWIRLTLSLGLLLFGVFSQIIALNKPVDEECKPGIPAPANIHAD